MISIPDISQTYPKESLTLDSRFVVGEGNARDLSSDANTGTLVTGRALSLDGTGDRIDCGVGMDFSSTGGSFAAWVKLTSTASGNKQIIETNTSGSNRFAIGITGGNAFRVSWYNGSGYSGKTSTTVSQTTWYHVVGTIDDSDNTTLYVNGVAMDEAYSSHGISGTNITTIGANGAGDSQYMIGSLSCVKAFNVVLTAAQALELYNNPEQVLPTGVSAANLKRYYPLSDYVDDSANSLNGLYVMDCGADKINGLAVNTGMDLAEQPPCPQLGLLPSTSRRYTVDDSYVSIGADSDINGLFSSGGTLAFWAQAMSIGHEVVAYLVYTGTGGYTVYLQNDSSGTAKILFKTYHGTTSGEWITDGQVITYGTWQHIVFAYDASSVSNDPVIYINGSVTAITEQQTPVGTTPADSAAKIIGNNDTPNRCWNGYISEVAMWKTVLDADAVAAVYNSGVQGFDLLSDSGNYDVSSSLKGWWKFNNLYTVQDLTSFNNDGSSTGSPVLSVIPEGTTAGTTLFGNTEEKRADNAVINLDGHSYVTIPHDVNTRPDVSEGFTVSVWAKMRNLGITSNPSMFSSGTSSNRWYLRVRGDSAEMIQFNFGTGPGNTDVGIGSHKITDNEWHHHVIVLESDGTDWTVGKVWYDGARVQSGGSDYSVDISARGSDDCSTTTAITIGATDASTADWQGAIAYPKIYARSLTENEIKLLYSSGHRVVGGL